MEHFISEPITPDTSTIDSARMARGEPGLARLFAWRGETLEVAEVLRVWRETGPCRHGSGERYVRKHWYEVKTTDGRTLKIYADRQPRPGSRSRQRWWLYSLQVPE